MADVLDAVGHKVIRCTVDKSLYDSADLESSLETFFSRPDLVSNDKQASESKGFTLSSVRITNYIGHYLRDFEPLLVNISSCILEHFYGPSCSSTELLFPRVWANRMEFGSSVDCHKHSEAGIDGAAVFYYRCPSDAGPLSIFESCEDSSNRFDVRVKTGDLIIHSKHVPHGVLPYEAEDPRICFVFEFILPSDA